MSAQPRERRALGTGTHYQLNGRQVPVLQTVPPSPPTGARSALRTVGIEIMPDSWRGERDSNTFYARTAVVERVNGAIVAICATDIDAAPLGGLERFATNAAVTAHALLLPAQWPACPWCGLPDPECPALADHIDYDRASETTVRGRWS